MTTKTRRARRLIGLLKSGTMGFALLSAMPTLAQDVTEDGALRLGTIFIDVDGQADDDANSIVARELWVGGKVATSILDTPASVSVITDKEIKARKATTTEELLQYSAGVHTDYYGTDDRNDYFMIRGFQATTYRDGLTLGSMRGVREEPLAYERVEVIRGANSTLFGMSDPGGSVNFVTRQPKFYRIAETGIGVDSLGGKEANFDFGNEIGTNSDFAFRITGKLRNGERDYDYSKDDETFLMGGLTWKPTDATSLVLIADYLKRDDTPNSGGYPLDREYDRSDFFGDPDFNYQDVERKSVSALLTHEFGGGLRLTSNLRYSDLTDNFGYLYINDVASRTGTVVPRDYFGTDSTAEELIGNVILQYDTTLGSVASSTLAGVEFRDAQSTSKSIYGNATPIDLANPVRAGAPATPFVYQDLKTDYSAQSIFFTQNFSFNEKLIVTGGLRRDFLDLRSNGTSWGAAVSESADYAETSGRFALTYKITDEVSAYASYVESVAPPSIGVQPERGKQYEIGAKYAPEGINALFSAAIYDLTKNNVTIAVPTETGLIERQTVGEMRVRGLDLEARAELTDALSLVAAYSYMNAEVVEGSLRNGASLNGKELTTVPRQSASLWTNYTFAEALPSGDLTAGLGLRYVGSYYFDAQNTRKSDSTLLVDAALTVDLNESTALALNVSNLFDEQHIVGSGTADYYNPGRVVGVSLRKTW